MRQEDLVTRPAGRGPADVACVGVTASEWLHGHMTKRLRARILEWGGPVSLAFDGLEHDPREVWQVGEIVGVCRWMLRDPEVMRALVVDGPTGGSVGLGAVEVAGAAAVPFEAGVIPGLLERAGCREHDRVVVRFEPQRSGRWVAVLYMVGEGQA